MWLVSALSGAGGPQVPPAAGTGLGLLGQLAWGALLVLGCCLAGVWCWARGSAREGAGTPTPPYLAVCGLGLALYFALVPAYFGAALWGASTVEF